MSSERFTQEPSRIVHIALRLICIVVAVSLLPPIFYSDKNHYWQAAQGISFTHLPYRDFLWEFPPFTTPLLALVPISFDHQIIFDILMVAAMVAFEVCTLRLVLSLAPTSMRGRISWYWLAVVVPLSSIAYFRLDWPSAFFGAVALYGILRSQSRATIGGILGGFGVKMWTVVAVVPLFALRRYKALILSILACALLLLLWYAFSPEGLRDFTNFRKGSAFQVESVPGSLVLAISDHGTFFEYGAWMVQDSGWSWVQPAMPLLFCVFSAAMGIYLWFKKSFDVVALFATLVLLLLLTSRIISPQYLVWLAPFVVLLFARSRRQASFFAFAVGLTLVEIGRYSSVLDGSQWAALLVVVRNVALLAMLVEWIRLIWLRKELT